MMEQPTRAPKPRPPHAAECAPSELMAAPRAARPAADIKVTTSDLRGQVGRIQNQVKEIQEVVRMYSSTTGPRRVRRPKMEAMSCEVADTNVRSCPSAPVLMDDSAARCARNLTALASMPGPLAEDKHR